MSRIVLRPGLRGPTSFVSLAHVPRYRIRFLNPDDSYAKAERSEDFADDSAVSDFVREHYARKALEIWDGERRVARRVSGAHDARARGHYSQSCRYAALSGWSVDGYERRHGVMPFEAFDALGQASDAVLAEVRRGMSAHPVRIRAQGHPQAPRTQISVRLSFHPMQFTDGAWRGWTTATIFSPATDGEALVADVAEAVRDAILSAHTTVGGLVPGGDTPRLKAILTRGVETTGGVDADWAMPWPRNR